MTDNLALSPIALASVTKPEGVQTFPANDRAAWLKMREADVTASVAAALFGQVHPYMTAYQLWALKSGLLKEDPTETPAMRRGRLLEPVALRLLAEEQPTWTIQPASHYYRDPKARLGATPDAFATRPDVEGLGVLQVKTVGHFAFKQGWKTPEGEVDVPLWIAVQCSLEAALTGASWGVVAAMSLGDGGLDMHVIDVPLKPALMARLRDLTADFWRRVEQGDAYEPDYGRDAAAIARIFADDDGGEVDLSGNNRLSEVVAQREALKAREADGNAAAKERKLLDTEIIAALGNATRGRLAGGGLISAPTTRRKAYAVEASSYRTVKVTGVSAPQHIARPAAATAAPSEFAPNF